MIFEASSQRTPRTPFRLRRARSSVLACVVGGLCACLGLAAGCATNEASTIPRARERDVARDLAAAPVWVTDGCRTFWRDPAARKQVVCGIGSAPSTRNRVATRETAIARARAVVGRSLEVTIESLVRFEEHGTDEAELRTIAHQLSSTSMRGLAVESVWQARSGEVHALVSVDLDQLQESVRNSSALSVDAREGLAERAAAAFAALDAEAARQNRESARRRDDD